MGNLSWAQFGTHANPDACSYSGKLAFSDEVDEDLFPAYERHADNSDCRAAIRFCDCGSPGVTHTRLLHVEEYRVAKPGSKPANLI